MVAARRGIDDGGCRQCGDDGGSGQGCTPPGTDPSSGAALCDQKGKNRIGLTKGDTIKVTAEI